MTFQTSMLFFIFPLKKCGGEVQLFQSGLNCVHVHFDHLILYLGTNNVKEKMNQLK